MKIVAMNDDEDCLRQLAMALRQIYPEAEIIEFRDSLYAAQYGFNHYVDGIYTEILMPRFDGRDVVQFVLHTNPRAKFCFVSRHENLRGDIQESWNAPFVGKPFTADNLPMICQL